MFSESPNSESEFDQFRVGPNLYNMADEQNDSHQQSNDEVISDSEIDTALEQLAANPDTEEMQELFKVMHEQRIMSWEEAERAMHDVDPANKIVKSGLKEVSRPAEPDNETDVEKCISRLNANDPTLTEINLNNMKRTPIPQMQRVFGAVRDNSYIKKLSIANTGLTDNAAEPLLDMIEGNKSLDSINLETNFLTGDFMAKLFKATLVQQTLREIKCVNQSQVFSTTAENEMLEVMSENKSLCKVSIQLRKPEARQIIDNAMLRNGEIRRIQRKEEAEQAKKKKSVGCAPTIVAS